MAPTEPIPKPKARVLLVEDHPVVYHGLAMLIDDEPDLSVCGGCESAREVMVLVRKLKPDVVVIDIALGDGNGLDLIKEIHERDEALPILALSMHDEAVYAERALRAGARGYIMKKEAMDKVMGAIRKVLGGELYISDRMASRMVTKLISPKTGANASPVETLSDREFEVFRMISQGTGPTEMAKRLGVSVKTIETHREHVKDKLNLKTAAELTRFALQWALEHS